VARRYQPILLLRHRQARKQAIHRKAGSRPESSNIDGNRSPGIWDRLGQELFFADFEVAGQHVGVPSKTSDAAVDVMKHDEVKVVPPPPGLFPAT
jgi:hypothetical protein